MSLLATGKSVLSRPPFRFPTNKVIDTGKSFVHQAIFIKFTVLVPIGTEPLTFFILEIIFKTRCDTVPQVYPILLFQLLVQLCLLHFG